MNTVKVKDLKIGNKIKFHDTEVYVVGWATKNGARAMLNKNKDGFGMISMSVTSPNYEDLQNRCELVEA